MTDANLLLGRLVPEYFPKIFGENEDEPLDVGITQKLFAELCSDINKDLDPSAKPLSPEEVALGFLRVANESMCRPIRTLTEARGYDTGHHDLGVFGGAGGQHACSIASSLGIGRVILHRYSSILSAYGMALADIVSEVQAPLACHFNGETLPEIKKIAESLRAKAESELRDQGISEDDDKEFELYLHMHYEGSDTLIMIPQPEDQWNFDEKFIERHRQEFGFTMPRQVHVGDVRLRAVGHRCTTEASVSPADELSELPIRATDAATATTTKKVYFENIGWQATPVYQLHALTAGDQVRGPALIIDNTQTILVTPNATATILKKHVVIHVAKILSLTAQPANVVDPVQLSVFGHRFMGIAEQMGRTLQKTSVSTNIKERLDFSCAIFSEEGRLVANGKLPLLQSRARANRCTAPHVPVHLGSMQYAVLWQHAHWKGKLQEGDVLVSNHPSKFSLLHPIINCAHFVSSSLWRHASSGYHSYHSFLRKGQNRLLCRL